MFDQSDLEIYDRITLPKSLKIPERSRLYSLKPIGIGTPSTESLSSHLTRLAEEHCLPLKKLVLGEIAPRIFSDQYQPEMLLKSVSSILGNSDAKPAINGMRDMTRSLVDALEQLTLREDLKYLSCLTYKEIIKERGLFRQNKAWCPKCFQQWVLEHKSIYEPLLWSFKDVNFCLKHSCQLSNRCPHCDSPQKAIANHSRLGYCDRCKQWLGNNLNDELEIADKERQILAGIGELIATTPDLDSPPTLPDIIQKLKLIQFFFERSLRQDLTQFIALGKTLEQLKIAITQHQDKPLNLVGLLIPICSLAKISVDQLMKEDVSSISKILEINFKNPIQKNSKRSSLASMFNRRT
ncbi:TniQ family protein [Waterburya agarophytonicola K14]|uniref:TniQ family protein n=1 Tax=Waterburya agarophytonicola KI4 TaxID=2874699 RepID=A0A964BWP8_9CYAN|nr:TniQ family protein [Waterburya agarophytonicola]MCC0179871.1 TniQ family protein [Waterburya agarophytonicola KI4]